MASHNPRIIVNFPPEYPELLNDIGQVIARNLFQMGFPEENAKQGAHMITETIRTELGGAAMYLPKGHLHDLSKRDREIFDKFNGRNLYELAREYNLTEMQIRNIIKRGMLRLRAKQQRPLFGTDDADED